MRKTNLLSVVALLLVVVFCFGACDLNIGVDPNAGTTAASESTTSSPEGTTAAPEDTTAAPDVTTGATGTVTDPTATEAATTPSEPKPMPTGKTLEMDIADLLNTPGFNGILFTDFSNIADVNLWQVVAQVEDKSYTGNIQDVYKKNGVTYLQDTGVRVVTASVLAEKMLLWTGEQLSAFTKDYGEQAVTYFATEGLYSVQFGGVESNFAKVVEITVEGTDTAVVKYTSDGRISDKWFTKYGSTTGDAEYMVATLKWTGDHFVIVSNVAYKGAAAQPEEMPTGTALTSAVEKLFNTQGFNGLLWTTYTNVQNANLWQVVAQIQDNWTGNIKEEVIQHGFDYNDQTGCNVVTATVLKNDLKLWTDIEDPNVFKTYENAPTYLLGTDVWYVQFGGVEFNPVKIIAAEYDKVDDVVYVRYTANGLMSDMWLIKDGDYSGDATEMLASLKWVGDHFIIISNQILWDNTDNHLFWVYASERTEKNMNTAGFNGILWSVFTEDKITTLDMWEIVSQFGDSYTGDIKAAFAAAGVTYDESTGLRLISEAKLAELMPLFTGHTLEEHLLGTSRTPIILKDQGLLAVQRGDVAQFMFGQTYMEFINGRYYIAYDYKGDAGMPKEAVVMLRYDGSYRIISNTYYQGPHDDPTGPEGAPELTEMNFKSDKSDLGNYQNTLKFDTAGKFTMSENVLEGYVSIEGGYSKTEKGFKISVVNSIPAGFKNSGIKEIEFEWVNSTTLKCLTELVTTNVGDLFYLESTAPESSLCLMWETDAIECAPQFYPTVMFNPDGSFVYNENCLEGMYEIKGTYIEYADKIECTVTQSVPNGFAGWDLKTITFEKDDATLILKTTICGSQSGAVFKPVI